VRLATPEDIAHAAFLVSDQALHDRQAINVTGGGFTDAK
jgi:hypothetical protein